MEIVRFSGSTDVIVCGATAAGQLNQIQRGGYAAAFTVGIGDTPLTGTCLPAHLRGR